MGSACCMSIESNINRVKLRLEAACAQAGRAPEEVGLVAVSKTRTLAEVTAAYQVGLRKFGESYVNEALNKMQQQGELAIEWHFIGAIQSNKTAQLARHFNWVHSVDSEKIASRLHRQRPDQLPPLNLLIQVNQDAEPSKRGLAPESVPALVEAIGKLDRLNLRGLMCIPKRQSSKELQLRACRQMQRLFTQINAEVAAIDCLSLGMSDDLEQAVICGSTLLRVGTAIFGPRPS